LTIHPLIQGEWFNDFAEKIICAVDIKYLKSGIVLFVDRMRIILLLELLFSKRFMKKEYVFFEKSIDEDKTFGQ